MDLHLPGWPLILADAAEDGTNGVPWTDFALLLAGGLLTTAGGWVAERLRFKTERQVRREQAEWELDQRRRERRERAYTESVVVAQEVMEAILGAWTYLTPANARQTIIDVSAAMARLSHTTFSEVIIFAAGDVRAMYAELVGAIEAMRQAVLVNAAKNQDIDSVLKDVAHEYPSFYKYRNISIKDTMASVDAAHRVATNTLDMVAEAMRHDLGYSERADQNDNGVS